MVAYCWGQKWFHGLDMVHDADMVWNVMFEIHVQNTNCMGKVMLQSLILNLKDFFKLIYKPIMRERWSKTSIGHLFADKIYDSTVT